MRDKNLTLQQFNIQLEKTIFSKFRGDWLLRTTVSDSPKILDSEEYSIFYPKDFRSLRSLAISQWYFPENLHWRILLDLKEMRKKHLTRKQVYELEILLMSKDICSLYLFETKRITARELFGNILGNELDFVLKEIKFASKRKKKFPKKPNFRDYRDKGSLRPNHQRIEKFDFSFTEYMNKVEKENYLQTKTLFKLRQLLTEKLLLLERSSNFEDNSKSPPVE